MHVDAAHKAEGADKPAIHVSYLPARGGDEVGGDAPLVALLGEGEVIFREEILIERQIVVQILETGDRREIDIPDVPFSCESVGEVQTAVETGIVIVDLARRDGLIGIASLGGVGKGGGVLKSVASTGLPNGFQACAEALGLADARVVIAVAEIAVGPVAVECCTENPLLQNRYVHNWASRKTQPPRNPLTS